MTAIATKPVDSISSEIRPDRLLARAGHPARDASGIGVRAARIVISRLLERMTRDSLTVIDNSRGAPATSTFGNHDVTGDDASLRAVVEVHDGRAWTALVSEGSVGLGRGYFEGWWDSDDPVAVVRIIIRNLEWIDEFRNRAARRTSRRGRRPRRRPVART